MAAKQPPISEQIKLACKAIADGSMPDRDVARIAEAISRVRGQTAGGAAPVTGSPWSAPAPAATPGGNQPIESMRREAKRLRRRLDRADELQRRRAFAADEATRLADARRAEAERRAGNRRLFGGPDESDQPLKPRTLTFQQVVDRDEAIKAACAPYDPSPLAEIEAERAADEWHALADFGATTLSLRAYVEAGVRRWAARQTVEPDDWSPFARP